VTPVRAGLLGCGSIAQRGILPHLTEADARDRIDLVAVCDVVEERASETARRFKVARAYSTPSNLYGDAEVELVLVATPIPYHYDNIIGALTSGKHVYVQKTITTTLAEAQKVRDLAVESGRQLIASPGQMLSPTLRHVKELVGRGAIGKVYWAFGVNASPGHEYERFRSGQEQTAEVDPSWYYQAGGGPVYDMAVYSLHSLTGVLGPARRVAAMSGIGLPERQWRGRKIRVEMDDNTMMLLDFGDSVFALVGGQNCVSGRHLPWGSLGFYGSAGSIEATSIDHVSGLPTRIQMWNRSGTAELLGFSDAVYSASNGRADLPYLSGRHLDHQEPNVFADIMHCVDCIRGEAEPVATAEHAAHVVEIIEKAYQAARTGQTQDLESTF
jgi:predicted dehydrogenase